MYQSGILFLFLLINDSIHLTISSSAHFQSFKSISITKIILLKNYCFLERYCRLMGIYNFSQHLSPLLLVTMLEGFASLTQFSLDG